MGLARAVPGRLSDCAGNLRDSSFTGRNTGVPGTQTSPDLARGGPLDRAELRHRHRRHGPGGHDHCVVLPDHRLHADLRQGRTALVRPGCLAGDGVHRLVELLLVTGDGRIFRQGRAQTPAAGGDASGDSYRLPCPVLAGGQSELQSLADRRVVAVVPVRLVQRCHGRGADRDHAGGSAHHRFFPGLQPGDRNLRRVYSGSLYLSDSCAG